VLQAIPKKEKPVIYVPVSYPLPILPDGVYVRSIKTNWDQMQIDELINTMDSDIALGLTPACVIAWTDGQYGVMEDIKSILGICEEREVWCHVDGYSMYY